MRKSGMNLLIIVLIVLIIGCLIVLLFGMETGLFSNEQNYDDEFYHEEEEKTVSVDEIVSAFREAGYIIEIASAEDDPDMDPANVNIDGLDSLTGYHFGKRTLIYNDEYLVEQGSILFLKMKDTDAAESYFDMAAQGVRSDPQAVVGKSKVTRRATVGDRTQYGRSDVISRVGDMIIIMTVEWDDYQDAEITYDFKPEEILEKLGY